MGRIQKAPNKSKAQVRTERTGKEVKAGAEIRDFGDRKTIVLYTTKNEIYQAVKEKALKEVLYETWKDCNPTKAKKVAADLYFPAKSKIALEKLIVQIQELGGNCLKSRACQKLLKAI